MDWRGFTLSEVRNASTLWPLYRACSDDGVKNVEKSFEEMIIR